MMIYDNQRSRSFIDLWPRLWQLKVKAIHWLLTKVTLIQHFQTSFPQKKKKKRKAVWSQISNFIWGLHGMKICSNVLDHMTKMASRPIYGKNLQNILLRNKEACDPESWYTATGTQVLPNLFKWWQWVYLDLFMICSNCFLMLLGECLYNIYSVLPSLFLFGQVVIQLPEIY